MIIVIGGGPTGFFAAITARESEPSQPVLLLEKSASVLTKVKISGGGRCNVTHACPDPRELTAHYPRGQKELLGPFHKWGPAETVHWFAARGVELKTEQDGRMFPVTDDSATIVDCLINTARDAGVEIRTRTAVAAINVSSTGGGLSVRLEDGNELEAARVLLATGGKSTGASTAPDGYSLACGLGHSLHEPVPSLFTFRISDPLLANLAGVAVSEAAVSLVPQIKKDRSLQQTGPLLVTHRGLSGPAVLKLSAWGARRLHELSYRFAVDVNWVPALSSGNLENELLERTRQQGKQQIRSAGLSSVPRRLWAALVDRADLAASIKWADLDRAGRIRLVSVLTETRLEVTGKDSFKEEFVTCGGVPLREIDFRTMASRVCPGLHLAGELVDIDGVTGGFNFQSCWTTGYLAGRGLAGASP
jgi:predicted Rossmann fold flavoprotein